MAELYPVSLTPKITERGLHVIKQWERERTLEYPDGWTTGGRPIRSKGFGHSDLLTTVDFDAMPVWTSEYAHEVLLKDLAYFGNLLLPHLKVPVPDTIWSICLSLAMNKGARGLYTSPQWEILHDGQEYNFERFCEAIKDYKIIAPNKITKEPEEKRGLRWRRIAEAGLFMQDRFMDYK